MESTTDNKNVNATQPTQASASAFPTPGQTAFPTPGQTAPTFPAPGQTTVKQPVSFAAPAQQPAPAQQTAATPAVVSQQPTAAATPAPAQQPAPAPQPAPVQAAQQPVQQPAPQPEPEETPAEEEQPEKKKKQKKLILNTQRILDDWKFERGKVMIFFMKLIKFLATLFCVLLYIGGFIFLIGANVAIGFWQPIAEIPNINTIAPIMLLIATFLVIWIPFTSKLTPYFKAFSISKWLDKNNINAQEVAKIFLQSRREKALTKYNKKRGSIGAEKADLSQATFSLLNEEHKSLYKSEFICALLFWLFISLVKLAFVYFLCGVVANISQQVKLIVEKTASFDFMTLVNFALNPVFLGLLGGLIVLSITAAITVACVAHKRNKNLYEWVKVEMKEFMPTEEYYEE